MGQGGGWKISKACLWKRGDTTNVHNFPPNVHNFSLTNVHNFNSSVSTINVYNFFFPANTSYALFNNASGKLTYIFSKVDEKGHRHILKIVKEVKPFFGISN